MAFNGLLEIDRVRVIYEGSGNFQVFSGLLWPKLRVLNCNWTLYCIYERFKISIPLETHQLIKSPPNLKNLVIKFKTWKMDGILSRRVNSMKIQKWQLLRIQCYLEFWLFTLRQICPSWVWQKRINLYYRTGSWVTKIFSIRFGN